jgi:hypothetical protein
MLFPAWRATPITTTQNHHTPRIYHYTHLLLLLALYVGPWPLELATSTPGYSYLATLFLERYQSTELLNRLYTSLSALLLLYCLESVPVLQHPF